MKRLRFRQEGASAVEFALILPVLVLLLFGIIQFGLTFARVQGMEAAAREGGRLAALGRDVTEAEVIARVEQAAPGFINDPQNDLVVTLTPDDDWCQSSQAQPRQVTVNVNLSSSAADKYSLNIPLFGDPEARYSTKAVFRCEATRS